MICSNNLNIKYVIWYAFGIPIAYIPCEYVLFIIRMILLLYKEDATTMP